MIELTLPAMTCGHCVTVVTRTVQRFDPAARVAVDLATHKVQIDAALDLQSLRAALADEGYPAA